MIEGDLNMNTEQITKARELISAYYQAKREAIDDQQKNLQTLGSIGLFSDGDEENS
jgi:hypothetical protein